MEARDEQAEAAPVADREDRIVRQGSILAALLAAAAALPGLWQPFLADDWINLAALREGFPWQTPFGYFRPLYFLSLRLESELVGYSPGLAHLTNLVLISVSAALVVVLVRRLAGSAAVAALSGAIFALHPFHVENAAWVAARADALFSVLFLAAALTYDRWRSGLRGIPVVALILFEAALLAKEAAVALPVLLVLVGLLDARRRPTRREWLRGLSPMFGVALAHFLLLRRAVLGGLGMDVLGSFGPYWIKKLLGFAAAAVIPLHAEVLETRPFVWGSVAVLAAFVLAASALAGSGRIPPAVFAAAPAFVVLVGPSLVSFQERYFFLPSAASAVALALLLRAAGPRLGVIAGLLLASIWLYALGDHWISWNAAGRTSARLVDDLVRASRRSDVDEIIVANMPHRIRGAPVSADFGAAVVVSGGRPVTVVPATRVDYPSVDDDALDGSFDLAVRRPPPEAEVRLRVPRVRYSRWVSPERPSGVASIRTDWGTISLNGSDGIRVVIRPGRGRAAYVWSEGRLELLF